MITFKKILGIPILLTAIWLGWVFTQLISPATGTLHSDKWVKWDNNIIVESLDSNRPVLLDVTADWCITCKVTEKLVFETDAFNQLTTKHNLLLVQADWTKKDDAITNLLASFNRYGVPLYILYLPNGTTKILPQLLGIGDLEEVLR